MKLSRSRCATCNTDTLHEHTHCTVCGREHEFAPEPMNAVKAARIMAMRRRSQRGNFNSRLRGER